MVAAIPLGTAGAALVVGAVGVGTAALVTGRWPAARPLTAMAVAAEVAFAPDTAKWRWRWRHRGRLQRGCCGCDGRCTLLPWDARVLGRQCGSQLAAVSTIPYLPIAQFGVGEGCVDVALAEVEEDGLPL